MNSSPMNELIQKAANHLHQAKHITVFTGAGISAESGISTYRDAQTGLWENHDPMLYATSIGFQLQPDTAWQWYLHRREVMKNAEPNPAHLQVARLQELKASTAIITQNIDDLHERAGSSHITHLHGDMFVNHCFANCQGTPTIIDPLLDSEELPPKCPHCDNFVRPGVVWFGEVLPVEAVREMKAQIAKTDLLLVIGLSGAITYGVPEIVKNDNQGNVIEVNPNESGITPFADIFLQARAGEIMPSLISELENLL